MDVEIRWVQVKIDKEFIFISGYFLNALMK